EPGLARLSLYRCDRGPRLCRGCRRARAGATRGGPRGTRRGAGRLRRRRGTQTPGARGALSALPRAQWRQRTRRRLWCVPAEAWADPDVAGPGAAIGAPPDLLARAGQNWGLAPINPLALRRRGFAPLIAALRANMRHAGVLRIDHVMSLQRLYLVPSGLPATLGACVNYPFDELFRLGAPET